LCDAPCCASDIAVDDGIGKLLRKFDEDAKLGEMKEDEYFKNRQPKGYQHLPKLGDDLREMSKLPPLQQHGQCDQDEPGWFHNLVRLSF
jgi:hypothetical protein